METHISYSLTKTIPGPKLKTEGVEQGFDTLMNWCEKYTIGTFSSIDLHLTVNEKDKVNFDFLDNEFLLKPVTSSILSNAEKYNILEWKVVISRLPTLFKFISSKLSFFETYDFQIVIGINFILLNEVGNALKGQNLYKENQHSNFLIFIDNNKITLEPYFYLPFQKDDETFKGFYSFLKDTFPFKIDDKNLYISIKNRKSKWGLTRIKLKR